MEIIKLIISLLAAVAIGWNVLFWLIRRDLSFSLPEKAALSYVIGLGAITLQMFLYSLLNIRFSIGGLLTPWLFIFAANVYLFKKTAPQGIRPVASRSGKFDIALMLGIMFQVMHTFFKALIKPMDSFDSIGNFAYKAKLFFANGRIPYELFLDRSIDIQHPDYPLLIPLSEAWVYMFLGRVNDLLVKALFSMFFLALILIFYFALRRLIGKRFSLIATFFLATIPHFLNYATIGYADFAVTMFSAASFIYIFLWMAHKRENKYLFLSACLAILAVWSKHEGVMFLLLSVAILALFILIDRRNISLNEAAGAAVFLLATALFTGSWFIYFHRLGFSNEFVNKETLHLSVIVKNLDRIPLILYEYQKHIFGPKKWNVSYLVFFAGFILYFKTAFRGYFKYITFYILLAFAGYSFFYLITPLEIRYHLQTSGSRMLIHFLPVAVFWIGYLAKEISDAEGNIHR